MPLYKLLEGKPIDDGEFDTVFKKEFRGSMSYHHWTPLETVLKAVGLLSQHAHHICDIGCGPGKFCLTGAMLSESHYTGVDYRKSFIDEAKRISGQYFLEDKTSFYCQDILDFDFGPYDGFYFYNPYLEHLYNKAITPEMEVSKSKVLKYTEHVYSTFEKLDHHVSIVTYDNLFSVIPLDKFELKESILGGKVCLYQNF